MNGLPKNEQDGAAPQDVRSRLESAKGPTFWRSMDELAKTPSFTEMLQREFPRQAAEWGNVDRRRFLQLTSASLALAGLVACEKQPPEKVVPYVRQPEDIVPGKPLFFATAAPYQGYGFGVLAESHMGRPTKVEGNDRHPASRGATDAYVQATVLDLYDPDRAVAVTELGQIRTWDSFVKRMEGLRLALGPVEGDGLRIVSGRTTSPTFGRLMNQLLAELPRAKWHIDEPLDGPGDAAAKAAFGGAAEVRYDFTKTNVVLAVDSDFLDHGPGAVAYSKDFSARRKAHTLDAARQMSRLYSLETIPSGTSSVADHRLAVKPSQIGQFLLALAARLGVAGAGAPAGLDEKMTAWVEEVADDLAAHAGSSAVVPGEYLPLEEQVLIHAINGRLGNLGRTVLVTEPVALASPSDRNTLAQLTEDIGAGRVSTLILLGVNPLYTAPGDSGLSAVFEKVPVRIHVGQHHDETAEYCHWQVAESHYLESWGDLRGPDGTVAIVQPLVNPLYDTQPALAVLAALLGRGFAPVLELVRETGQAHAAAQGGAGGFEKTWRRWLHDGFIPGTAAAIKAVAVDGGAVAAAAAALAGRAASGLELMFRPDPTVLDGRGANNGWLQECPKPITKLTWDNALLMSPKTGRDAGLGEVLRKGEQVPWAPMLSLEANGKNLAAAVWIVPGMADGVILLHLGGGRRRGGNLLKEAGFDAAVVRSQSSPWLTLSGVSTRPYDETYTLVSTQDHHSMEGRAPVRTTNVATYEAHPDEPIEWLLHVDPRKTMMPAEKLYDYSKGYRWGMSIDLTTCTGCNACLVACVAENNIPAIGKGEVRHGREMHWIRIDRYFTGDDADNVEEVVHQPVPCMQCEQAPCEVVCPVAATVHSDEGLNDMVYNRCVGTRYCSNNCPYKVRRFNFLLYQDFETPSLKLGRNPDVSVRSRGVMEKCTYCVQRINHARIDSKREKRKIKDGEVVVACQQACPCDAITFGDLNDPNSQVSKAKSSGLDYSLLDELGTRPRTTYLARVSNPNAKLWARLYPNRPMVGERHGHGKPGAHGGGHGKPGGHGEPAHGAPAHGAAPAAPEHGAAPTGH